MRNYFIVSLLLLGMTAFAGEEKTEMFDFSEGLSVFLASQHYADALQTARDAIPEYSRDRMTVKSIKVISVGPFIVNICVHLEVTHIHIYPDDRQDYTVIDHGVIVGALQRSRDGWFRGRDFEFIPASEESE